MTSCLGPVGDESLCTRRQVLGGRAPVRELAPAWPLNGRVESPKEAFHAPLLGETVQAINGSPLAGAKNALRESAVLSVGVTRKTSVGP